MRVEIRDNRVEEKAEALARAQRKAKSDDKKIAVGNANGDFFCGLGER